MGTHKFKIDGQDFEVQVGTRMGSRVDVSVNGKTYEVEIEGGSSPMVAAAAPAAAPVAAPTPAAPPRPAPAAPSAGATGAAGEVLAPISGVVLTVDTSAGQSVEPNTKVLVLEAMKMENEIFAAISGKVTQVHVQPQQEVREGDLLVSIDPS